MKIWDGKGWFLRKEGFTNGREFDKILFEIF